MSVPIRSTSDILAALREHPEWRDELRREILTEELLELPAKAAKAELERKEDSRRIWEAIGQLTVAQQRTEATLQSFMEATEKRFAEVEKRLDKLEATLQSFMVATEKRFVEVEKRLDKLEATLQSFMEATEKRFAEVEKRLDKLEATLQSFMVATQESFRVVSNKLRELDGGIVEIRSIQKLGNYLYDWMDRVEVLDQRTINQATDIAIKAGVIRRDERRRLGAADALLSGEDVATGEPACAAVEASGVVETIDVDRAAERAALLLKTMSKAVASNPVKFAELFPGPPTKAYALVVGREITEEARQEAERKGVLFARYHNGASLGER